MKKAIAHFFLIAIDIGCIYAIWFLFSEIDRINTAIGYSDVIKTLSTTYLLSLSIAVIALHTLIIIDNTTISEKIQNKIVYSTIAGCLAFISFSTYYWMQSIWKIESSGYYYCADSSKNYFRGSIEYYAKNQKNCP